MNVKNYTILPALRVFDRRHDPAESLRLAQTWPEPTDTSWCTRAAGVEQDISRSATRRWESNANRKRFYFSAGPPENTEINKIMFPSLEENVTWWLAGLSCWLEYKRQTAAVLPCHGDVTEMSLSARNVLFVWYSDNQYSILYGNLTYKLGSSY